MSHHLDCWLDRSQTLNELQTTDLTNSILRVTEVFTIRLLKRLRYTLIAALFQIARILLRRIYLYADNCLLTILFIDENGTRNITVIVGYEEWTVKNEFSIKPYKIFKSKFLNKRILENSQSLSKTTLPRNVKEGRRERYRHLQGPKIPKLFCSGSCNT